jgi:hypothetical protein
MFAMLAYTGSNTTPSPNFDLAGLPDINFSQRNGHYIFTEKYRIGYLFAQSATMTDARLLTPTYSALNSDGHRIISFQRAAGVGGVPTLADKMLERPLEVPQNEEFQFQASCTGAAEQQYGLMILLTDGWSANCDVGPQITMEATTASFTPAANVWTEPVPLVFNANPRGGVYAVNASSLQQAGDVLAFRIIFPRRPIYYGRSMFPGWIAQNAIGSFEDVITQANRFHLGCWGYFHTFEPPQLSVFATTSAAMTPILRMWTTYLGGDESLLLQKIAQAR